MPKRLTIEDFAVLRGPLESGRQGLGSLGGTLLIFIFLQAILFLLEYYVGGYSLFPNNEKIIMVHLWITLVLIIFSIIYSIPAIYLKSQKLQYFLVLLVSQNVGTVSLYLLVMFLIGTEEAGINADEKLLIMIAQLIILFGFLVFVATFIRLYILLRKGHYRKGSKNDVRRGKFETKSYIPIAILGSIGLVFVIQYLIRKSYIANLEILVVVIIGITIIYTMLFILPEQLVILYCKFRFKSFNFNRRGYLESED